MPYEIKAMGKRNDIINWLSENVGQYKSDHGFWSATGTGWELLPHGADYYSSVFQEPQKYILRIWDKDQAFLAKLRWE